MFKQGIGERVNSWHPFTGTQHVDFTIQGNESNNKKKKSTGKKQKTLKSLNSAFNYI